PPEVPPRAKDTPPPRPSTTPPPQQPKAPPQPTAKDRLARRLSGIAPSYKEAIKSPSHKAALEQQYAKLSGEVRNQNFEIALKSVAELETLVSKATFDLRKAEKTETRRAKMVDRF